MKKYILPTVGVATLIGALMLIAVYGFGQFQRITADFRGETSQIEKTQANANYRIAAYDHFYDRCAGVQSLESKIKNMKTELEAADSDQRKTVLNTSITASKNKRAELINSYNADARKEGTRGQFKASDLPYELNEKKEETR